MWETIFNFVIVPILIFIGGIQLIAIGLIGEYIGKVYKETKKRPKYIVDIDLFNLPVPHHLMNDEDLADERLQLNLKTN